MFAIKLLSLTNKLSASTQCALIADHWFPGLAVAYIQQYRRTRHDESAALIPPRRSAACIDDDRLCLRVLLALWNLPIADYRSHSRCGIRVYLCMYVDVYLHAILRTSNMCVLLMDTLILTFMYFYVASMQATRISAWVSTFPPPSVYY